LLTARDIIKSRAIVLLSAVLRAMAGCTIEPTPSHASAVLCSIVILIVFKALSNIAAAVKELTVVELAVY
jgi:hypothetical protein